MENSKFLAVVFIWIALLSWTAAMLRFQWVKRHSLSRLFWSCGALFLLLHLLASFHGFYHWSHSYALTETARKTEQVTGVPTSIGLWVNYIFALLLIVDAILQWTSNRGVRPRWFVEGIVIFMIVNGAIIFASGPVRVYGILLLILVAISALTNRKTVREP